MARTLLREDKRKSTTSFYSTATASNEIHAMIVDVTNKVADLVEACHDPSQSDIQLHVCQVSSSVKSVLTEANIVDNESPLLRMYPELARQHRIVLNALSRLVEKGKGLQRSNLVANIDEEQDQVSYFANHLLNEMDMFERLLLMIPRHSSSASTESTVDSTSHSSMFLFDTPRSSVSSLGYSSTMSTSSTSLRQYMTETRLSSNSSVSLIPRVVSVSDIEQILQNILDHQALIDELMGGLVITLERYLVNRHRATEMLETTRRALEAVRTFLAVVEHVCSNLGDLDYNRRLSMIPEDPSLVSLMFTKESVYSAITNLVSAVRALTGPQQNEEAVDSEHDVDKDDLEHLHVCCEDVVRTTNECAACVRACLETESEENQVVHMHNIQESNKSKVSTDGSFNRSETLSTLLRKVSTLQAIQQYREDQKKDTSTCDKVEQIHSHSEQDIEGLAVQVAPKQIEINVAKDEPIEEDINDLLDSRTSLQLSISPSPSTSTAETSGNEITDSQVNSSSDIDGPAETSHPTGINDPIEITHPIDTLLSSRAQASAIKNSQILQMPPLPPKNNFNLKPSMSAAIPLPSNNSTPLTRETLKSIPKEVSILKYRRSRGLSVSSLRPSISKSRSERISNLSSTETLPEPMRLQKLPSWMLLGHTSDKSENIIPTASMSLQIPKVVH